jgi:hypothetical protein
MKRIVLVGWLLLVACSDGGGDRDSSQAATKARPEAAPAAPAPPADDDAPAPAAPADADADGDGAGTTAGETWLEVYRIGNGYLFRSEAPDDPWSFVVPAETMRTSDDNGRFFAQVDGTLLQMMRIAQSDFAGQAPLPAYRKHETDFLRGVGGTVLDSRECDAGVPHEEWRMALKGKEMTVASFQTARSILVVSVSQAEPGATDVLDKLHSVCDSVVLQAPDVPAAGD